MIESSLAGAYVLVIEDDLSIREIINIMLDFFKVTSRSVSNGARALEFLFEAERLPSLILLDLRMPVMDGEVFRRRQLESPGLCSIPTVLLSADTHVEGLASRMGISEILIKPFSHNDLLKAINMHLPLSKERSSALP